MDHLVLFRDRSIATLKLRLMHSFKESHQPTLAMDYSNTLADLHTSILSDTTSACLTETELLFLARQSTSSSRLTLGHDNAPPTTQLVTVSRNKTDLQTTSLDTLSSSMFLPTISDEPSMCNTRRDGEIVTKSRSWLRPVGSYQWRWPRWTVHSASTSILAARETNCSIVGLSSPPLDVEKVPMSSNVVNRKRLQRRKTVAIVEGESFNKKHFYETPHSSSFVLEGSAAKLGRDSSFDLDTNANNAYPDTTGISTLSSISSSGVRYSFSLKKQFHSFSLFVFRLLVRWFLTSFHFAYIYILSHVYLLQTSF